MAYNYNNYKKFYEAMDSQQQQKRATQNKNDSDFQNFYSQYTNESRNNNVATTKNTPTSNSNRYGSGSYTYNPTSWYYEKTAPKTSWDWVYEYDPTTWYYENTSSPKTNQYTDYSKYNNTGSNTGNSQSFYWNNQNYTGNANTLNGTLAWMANDIYNQWQKGYSDLMWGSNYATNFDDAVNNKLKSAFWLNSLDELKNKYPEQYESVVQALESVRWVWDATDPTQRQMLDWYLQGIIWSGVGAWSDMSKLNVLNQSLMDKFENWEQVSKDMQNIVKLQTEWLTTAEIAKQMWISEDQVQQAILAYNWLDNKLWEYYKLKEWVAKDITEKFDTQMQRNDEEKRIALERANRQVERLTEDFNTSIERQKQQNDINAHNADAIAGRTGLWFSKRWIEGLNYVAEQARQIIDDITKNYDRNNQNLADGIADIIRNWQYNNDDLMKASEDALTAAKNNFTSNMLAVQQQYGTVGLQAQQALANNVQWFIEQAEAIYDNALTRQQQNLTNLINNVSNINALEAQNLTMRNAKIQQFQQEALTMNRSQLQQLAQQLWMSSDEFGDLVSYQVQAVQNQLNGYVPWAWVMFQDEINSLLQWWANAQEVIQWVMNQPEFKAMSQTGWTDEWVRLNDNTLYNKKDGTFKSFNGEWGSSDYSSTSYEMWNYGATNNYVSSQTVNGQDYGVSENTYYWLQDFISSHQVGSTGWQCGKFVNDYLQSLGLDRVFTDPIDKKKAAINTPEWYKPQVWDIVIMDSPTSRKYGHVAIVTAVDGDKITTLESNKKWEWEVFSRTIDTSKQNRLGGQIFGYYHPDGVATNVNNNAGGNQQQYNQLLVDLFNKDNLTSEDKKTIQSFWMSLADFWNAKRNYTQQNQWTGKTQAEKMADAILNGVWALPAKNSKEYTEMTIALNDRVKEIWGWEYPDGLALINYSVINDKELSDTLATNLSSTMQSLYSTDMLMDLLDENSDKIWPILSKMEWWNPYNADYAAIKSSINQMASNIARWFGEKWVLTDQDIERYMKTIPNEKMWKNAREVVWTLLKAKLYDGFVRSLETYAKSHRDVSMFASDYQDAVNWLIDNWFREDPNGTIKTSNNISPIQALQNQLTWYNTQSWGRIWWNIRAWWTMQSWKSF